ncbi:hypothetical protein AB838_14335 [Rhodobacteraceae bacterium (ex Bugula neritina AB1)]|nr:hypothetical protein AB838_14335 [Rhodobacteraceae bacterium (ex Bugula neritina AB1)]
MANRLRRKAPAAGANQRTGAGFTGQGKFLPDVVFSARGPAGLHSRSTGALQGATPGIARILLAAWSLPAPGIGTAQGVPPAL